MQRKLSATLALLVCFGIAMTAAHAQGKCSLNTFEGTYVAFDKGSSLTVDLTSAGVIGPWPGAPTNPVAWVAQGIIPFANISKVTYTSDGEGDGYFWMFAGSVRPALQPIPVHVTVTELNEDCSGKFQYTLANGAVIQERFIIFDNGRQYRSVPATLAVPAIPTLAWVGTGNRISKGSAPVDFCGPQTAHGEYLITCDNIVRSPLYQTKAVADTFLLRKDISMQGDYSGLLYEKLGPSFIDARPVSGSVTVNPDCSFAGTFDIEGIGGTFEERGLLFNEGKEFYAMYIYSSASPIDNQGVKFSVCQGIRIGQ